MLRQVRKRDKWSRPTPYARKPSVLTTELSAALNCAGPARFLGAGVMAEPVEVIAEPIQSCDGVKFLDTYESKADFEVAIKGMHQQKGSRPIVWRDRCLPQASKFRFVSVVWSVRAHT